MGTVLLLPRLLVPVRPRLQVLEQMAVVIEGELIAAVLPASEALEIYPDASRIELPDHVLLPGFINMHTHSAMSLLRGYADDLDLQVWLNDHIWPVEKTFLGPDERQKSLEGLPVLLVDDSHGRGGSCRLWRTRGLPSLPERAASRLQG